jgi:hypothetical protein
MKMTSKGSLEENGKNFYYPKGFRAYRDCHDLANYFSQKWDAKVDIKLDVGYRVNYLVEIDGSSFIL